MNDAEAMVVDHTRVGAAFRRLSIPLAVQQLGDQLLGIVDTIAIGYLGTVSLAGVTAATTVFFTSS
jgi:Na+-driven multidrug efflux pump